MANAQNQGTLSAVATTEGLGGLMRSLTPLNPDNIEDNTLSSLLELSRTCEALQQKNCSSPVPSPAGGDVRKTVSPKTDQNGALTNSLENCKDELGKGPLLSSTKIPSSLSSLQSLKGTSLVCSQEGSSEGTNSNKLLANHHSSSHPSGNRIGDGLEDGEDEDEDEGDANSGEEEEMDYEDASYNKIGMSMSECQPHNLQSLQRNFTNSRSQIDFSKLNCYSPHNSHISSLALSKGASSHCTHEFDSNQLEEESLSDGESFDGKIVYNPDGSAYIIEGESELSDSESLLDVSQLEGSIVDHRGKPATSQIPSFPQIANAFYIHKNPSFYNSYFMFPDNRPRHVAPIMHSFKVYDLRSKKSSEQDRKDSEQEEVKNKASKMALHPALLSEEISSVPTKPILMCFICKLSFGYTKSFMAHAIGEHNMSLTEEEREIMSRKNASAIIQGLGKEKEPLMSFLEPTSSPQSESSDCQTIPRPYLPPPLFNASMGTSVGNATSNTNVSYVYSNAKVTPVEHVSKDNKVPSSEEKPGKDRQLSKCEDNSSNCSSAAHTPSPSVGSNPSNRVSTNLYPKGATHPNLTSDPDQNSGAMVSAQSPASSPRVGSRPGSHQWTTPSPQKDSRGNSPHPLTNSTPGSADGSSGAARKLKMTDDGEPLYRPFDSGSPKSQESEVDRRNPDCSAMTYKLSSANEMYQHAMSSAGAGIMSQSSPTKITTLPMSQSVSYSPSAGSSTVTGGQQMDSAHPMSGIVIRSGCEDHPQGNISGVECPKCDLILGSTRSLGGHMTMMHSRNSCKTLKCPKCNWHYKYQETLEIHMKEKHPENDTQCIYCLTSQPHPRLARGEVYTCGYKPYRCEVCNYSTTTKGNLSIHMQSDKHINNMQEIQNGTVPTTEIKMPPSQPPPPPPPPLTPDANAMKKNKPKPTWRCDVCNYETNVARNLRIHMTSEKHTHNMLVLQQNVKHMQRDMQFQMSQLALMGQDPLSIMAGLPPGMAPGMPPFPFDQMFMGPGLGTQGMMESPVDLTKQENGLNPTNMNQGMTSSHPMDLKNNNNEPCRIFQCSVCNIFSTDSLESLHQHMQLDRSKHCGEHDDSVTNVGGTYMCNLCQYKTNLKANFQLHCKTDKHLQRLQLVNHIREGGPANEWRLKYMSAGNPIQVRCNACDYYTNSIHKLQLHRTNPRHETNAKLFHHLQARESCLAVDAMRYYSCSLCNFNTRAKINLIQHVRSMNHMRNESLRLIQLKEQGKEHQYILENIFQVKEFTETDIVKFDETDGEPIDCGVPVPDGDLPPEFAAENAYREAADFKGAVPKLNCPFCTFSSTNEMQIQLHVQTQHIGPQGMNMGPGGTTNAHKDYLCPLCQEKCAHLGDLEKHLFQVHNVSAEGMHRLLSMVFTPEPQNTSPNKSSSSNSSSKAREESTAQPSPKEIPIKTEPTDSGGNNDMSPHERNSKSKAISGEEETTDILELQAEMFESQALKLAEEASMEGVVIGEKDIDDNYRCQTCTKTFQNIDALYSHQNELGHLELKQTPRGPGYLCWKKGCNQYFKTGEALQMHFKEIHARTPTVSVSERHAYKYRCTQCSLAFKTLEKLQLHSFYHIIRSATKCVVCGKSFRSIAAMKKHVDNTHLDSMSPAELEQYRANLASTAPLGLLGMPIPDPMMLGALGMGTAQIPPLIPFGGQLPVPQMNLLQTAESAKELSSIKNSSSQDKGDEKADVSMEISSCNSHEDHQKDDGDKYEFTGRAESTPNAMDTDDSLSNPDVDNPEYKDQQFMEDYVNSQAIAENSYSDPCRKYKCHRCKVAFTKQSYLSAHNKTLMHRKGDKINYPMEKYMDPNRPYKCEVCKESFTQKNILLVHYNSVSHLHKLKQQQQDGSAEDSTPMEVSTPDHVTSSPNSSGMTVTTTTTSPHIAAPEEKKPYKCNICKVSYSQSATMDIHIRSVLHQTRASKLQELATSGQIDLNQPLIEQPDMPNPKTHLLMQEQQKKVLQEIIQQHQKQESQKPPTIISSSGASSQASQMPLMSPPPLVRVPTSDGNPPQRSGSASASSEKLLTSAPSNNSAPNTFTGGSLLKVKTEDQFGQSQQSFTCQMCNAVFVTQDLLAQHQQLLCYAQLTSLRGMPRTKPHIQKNLLENIGFECVMQFNEFYQKIKVEEKENILKDMKDNPGNDDDAKDNKSASEDKDLPWDDLPEMNKGKCITCNKEFSSIWVLKAHQEEVHKQLLPIEYIEEFGIKFKEQYDKKQMTTNAPENEPVPAAIEPPVSTDINSADIVKTLSQNVMDDKNVMMPNLASDLSMAQAMQMMQVPMFMNSMMHLPMQMGNMPMSMNMIPPLMPMMMPMGHEMYPPGFPPLSMMDPNVVLAQQQQQAAALAAQQQKRARTRINDEQLKILRAYFDINNSPTEEQILEMADKSGLPPKVIKHWFRNTLFKERQRNKDSPYNFSIPPSTSLNLEEYERTGKIEEDEEEEHYEKQQTFERHPKEKEVRQETVRPKPISENIRPKPPQDTSHMKPKMSEQLEMSRPNSHIQDNQHDNHDRESVTSVGESIISSAPSTPAPTPNTAPAMPITPVLPPPSMSGLTPAGVSFAEFSAALQALPMGPSVTSVAGRNSAPTTPQHSTPLPQPVLSPSHSNSMAGKRANRTRFTDYQIKVLQEYFEQNAYPKDDDLEHLSRLLNLSPRVIVVWFQNARQKARKNYENQPPLDMTEETSKFTRTPGLNYQCKKCFTVFQRYYELIKHQRTHCYKDEKKLPFNFNQIGRSGQSSTSYADSEESGDSGKIPEAEMQSPRSVAASTPKSNSMSTPSTPSTSGKGIEYKCEKCNLVLPRLELWREHQNIHNMNPSLFSPFSNSAFAMLQNVAQQQQPSSSNVNTSTSSSQSQQSSPMAAFEESMSIKRRLEEYDDDRDDQPSRDKRMRTTILPEQLDYLYQKYQLDCNPSRKQLENIAQEVGLKKRVVQVWFQNTRARERKGQFRAHQQIIHKRCPFCRALFRAKSALESHLATKHPEEMAKGEINIDSIPDEIPDGSSSSPPPSGTPNLDMAKLLNNPYNMPNPMMPMVPTSTSGSRSQDQVQSNMKKLYEDSLKKYLDELSHASHQPKQSATSPEECGKSSNVKQEQDDAPLDLSKPHGSGNIKEEAGERYYDYGALSRSMEESELSDSSNFDFNVDESCYAEESNPPSPSSSTSSIHPHLMPMGSKSVMPIKRYRTQMSSVQIRLMKNLFTHYKTPTMAECQMVGREVGLPKRVVQVWFQNARAKEKKAKLNYAKAFGGAQVPELDFQRPPEECTLCNFKYSHKYTVQDHIFTRKHIDNVKQLVQSQADAEQGTATVSSSREKHEGREAGDDMSTDPSKLWSASSEPSPVAAHPHLAQLHAMGLQALTKQGGSTKEPSSKPGKGRVKQEPKDTEAKEPKKAQAVPPSGGNVSASAAAAMLNPFGMMPGMMPPGAAADLGMAAATGMLPFLYPGLGGLPPPGMPLIPGMMPGPESMFMYDPTTFGTPLTLLQIPPEAIQEIQAQVQDPSCTLARYTQDCQTTSNLKRLLRNSDLMLFTESSLDVGYICKKCHMVYPGKDACLHHQMSVCYQGKNLSETKSILKLEQVQYKCTACHEKLSTHEDVLNHCKGEAHHRQAARKIHRDSRPASRASTNTPPSASSTPKVRSAEGTPVADRSSSASSSENAALHRREKHAD